MVGRERVRYTATERDLGTDDCEVDALATGDAQEIRWFAGIGRYAARDGTDAGVPGSAQYLRNRALARQLPRKRVLPCTATDNEDLHVNPR
jgi:hypothetical protein